MIRRMMLSSALMLAMPVAGFAQANPKKIQKGIDSLDDLPYNKQLALTLKLAMDIRALPPGAEKLKLAGSLLDEATEGDDGQGMMQAVIDTLTQALKETPQPPNKLGKPADPYVELAKYVRYDGMTTTLEDRQYGQAMQDLIADDVDASKADFTLKDINGKAVTLSQLRGKIVLVNFWATWCQPCNDEMPDLDAIYTHYQSQGLVILSITQEDPKAVVSWMQQFGEYHPPILLDEGGKATRQFHVDDLPTSFVYNREGKLVAKAIDTRTQRQFFSMLDAGGLKPQ